MQEKMSIIQLLHACMRLWEKPSTSSLNQKTCAVRYGKYIEGINGKLSIRNACLVKSRGKERIY